jgi:hypothetical protein
MAGFTQTFGGTVVYASDVSYRAVALSANVTLSWPTELATNTNVVASIMDVTPAAGALTITMPPANEASVGETALFFNAGGVTFTVADSGGNTIVSVAAGIAWQVYLTGNSTANGTWRATQYGAGTSSASAGSLVGAGIKAINTTLNQSMSVTSLSINYTLGDADRAGAFVWTGGAGTLTLPSAGTVGNDWFFQVRNGGTGAISIAATGGQLINGGTTLAFNPGDSAIVVCDGTSFFTIGFGQSASFSFDFVSIDLTAQASPYTLSGANLNRIAYQFSGTITGNMQVVVPSTIQQYWVANETDLASDPYTIEVKTVSGTGITISRNARAILYCNGTDVIDADTSTVSFPISVAQGGTGATTASGARVNLGGTSTGIAVFTAANATAGRTALTAAASGANSDITSLTGLTTPLSVSQGGTGATTAAAARTALGTAGLTDNNTFTGTQIVSVNSASEAVRITQVGAGNALVVEDSANPDATPFVVTAVGDVGVGTAGPGYRLDIASGDTTVNIGYAMRIRSNATATAAAMQFTNSGISAQNGVIICTDAGAMTLQSDGAVSFLAFRTNGAEQMRIAPTGDVGIGNTPSGTYKLEVTGATYSSSMVLGAALPVASGGTNATTAAAARTSLGAAASGANTDITALDQDVTITATGTIAATTIGYRGIPQNAQTGAYTLVLADAGKHISNTTGGFAIPANGTTAFPIGTTIVVYNNSGSSQNVTITTDTLRLAGTATTGTRALAQRGLATLVKVATTEWVASGAGLT